MVESEYQNLLSRRLRLVGRLGLLRELYSRAHLRVVNEAARNPHAPAIFTPTTLRRPLSTHAHNTQAPAVFTRPQPSDARHPHTLHVLGAMIPLIAFFRTASGDTY